MHNEVLRNLFSSANMIRMMKSRGLRWAGHAARIGGRQMHVGYWWESQNEREHYQNQDIGGWIIFK
jgi:hypothetical protein